MDIGYTKKLYILPFDHRSSFIKGLLGQAGDPTEEQIALVKEMKQMIYNAFETAVKTHIPKEDAAILVDEQFGSDILKDATDKGYITLLPTEKSGQEAFTFEYGDDFAAHIDHFKPTFVKALVRYNPQGNQEVNKNQTEKLKKLSTFCHSNGYKFLIEPLIPATHEQLSTLENSQERYDTELRPSLTIEMIKQLQDAEVEVDVWKLEGMDTSDDYKRAVNQARVNGRQQVGIVILGRGAERNQVDHWIVSGRDIAGVIGFAVGRTIFWNPLKSYLSEEINKDTAIKQISENYIYYYNLFTNKSSI